MLKDVCGSNLLNNKCDCLYSIDIYVCFAMPMSERGVDVGGSFDNKEVFYKPWTWFRSSDKVAVDNTTVGGTSGVAQKEIIMEKVSRVALKSSTGWRYNPTEKVSELLEKTSRFNDWRDYRLAYGVCTKKFNDPLKLKWATPLSAQYDPSCEELFNGIHLEQGQNYFLLISQLAEGLRDPEVRDDPDNVERFKNCTWRYRDLYITPATRPDAPTLLGPSAKSPPDAPADAAVVAPSLNTTDEVPLRVKLAALQTLNF